MAVGGMDGNKRGSNSVRFSASLVLGNSNSLYRSGSQASNSNTPINEEGEKIEEDVTSAVVNAVRSNQYSVSGDKVL